MLRRRMMFNKSRLPSEYQEVEYIESNGTQFINTKVAPTNNTRVETKFFNNSISSWYMFGSRSATFLFTQTGSYSGSTISAVVNGVNTETGWTRQSSGATYEVVLETKTNVYDYSIEDLTNDRSYSVSDVAYTPFTTSEKIYIFALRSTYIQKGTTRFYYFKIYQDNVLIRDFVPCYRKSDDVIGMYDLVNDVFYTNTGTGTFAK